MSRAQGSPLLNCTWREIPLNSSWQRQRTGRHIKQSLSRSPINTSHSLASLQTSPPPRPGLCAPSNNAAEPGRAFNMFARRTFSHLKRTSLTACYLSSCSAENTSACSPPHTVDVSGAVVFFTYTSDVPSGTRWAKLLLKEARRRPAKRRGEKKEKEKRRGKKSHVKHICNINSCFDLISLITVYSSTFKSFRKRSEE